MTKKEIINGLVKIGLGTFTGCAISYVVYLISKEFLD